ncbi:hypothetical protein OF83DRAFT_652307 [Amylostereum chailletii]|nr:hypothetical protein OF83DRAFT_652307 [Amylostereum chailletii]
MVHGCGGTRFVHHRLLLNLALSGAADPSDAFTAPSLAARVSSSPPPPLPRFSPPSEDLSSPRRHSQQPHAWPRQTPCSTIRGLYSDSPTASDSHDLPRA